MTEHPRELFHSYATPLPIDDWSTYIVDDYGISYTSGRWPFHRDTIRLAPDVGYGHDHVSEYVMLWQDSCHSQLAMAELNLTLRPEKLGLWVVSVSAYLDLVHGTVALTPEDIPPELREQAMIKADRILQLLAAERARRNSPEHPGEPDTAYEKFTRSTDPLTGRRPS